LINILVAGGIAHSPAHLLVAAYEQPLSKLSLWNRSLAYHAPRVVSRGFLLDYGRRAPVPILCQYIGNGEAATANNAYFLPQELNNERLLPMMESLTQQAQAK